jgi:hypothetical protein
VDQSRVSESACHAPSFIPTRDWLRDNGRDPVMAKGVEFTNVRIFEAETRRMPNFALHELAHAYHNRTVRMSFGNLEIKAAYEKAKASGKYDRVERKDSEGRSRMDRAYAMTNPQEYFAECTEAYFSRNDFFPFTRDELKQHDPEMFELLGERIFGVATCAFAAPEVHPGAAIYKKLCAECHGDRGQGVEDEYDEALTGEKTIEALARQIDRTMPEDDPDKTTPRTPS